MFCEWLCTPKWAAALKGRRAVELGTGTGLIGVTAACLGAHVTVTDVTYILDATTRVNVAQHAAAVSAAGGSVTVAEHRWGDAVGPALDAPYDFILASEVVFDESLYEPLLASFTALAGDKTVVLFAARYRGGCSLDTFMELVRARFDVTPVHFEAESPMATLMHGATGLSKTRYAPLMFEWRKKPPPPAAVAT